MTEPKPLAIPGDVEDVFRPLSEPEVARVAKLITKVSAKLRQKCPFDLDARIEQFTSGAGGATALDPAIVADVVATIVKRFLVNPEGVASGTDSVGPFSHSATYVNRYDKTGSDVRGAIQITDSDIDQLRPAVPADGPFSFQVGVPHPAVLVPAAARGAYVRPGLGPIVVPDITPGIGVE